MSTNELAQKVATIQKKMDEDVAEIKRIEAGKNQLFCLLMEFRVPKGDLEQGYHGCQEG